MRRVVLASAVLLAPLLVVPTASAAPAPELCSADARRGEVPAAFPIAACVDGTSVTLHNDRDRPVIVTGRGTFGTRAMLRTEDGVHADVVRRTSPSALVLLPGEVARWPIGPGSITLTVAPLPIPSAPEIVAVLEQALAGERPEEGAQALYDSAAALVGEVAAAARARAACVEGRNFLGATACDVTAAAAIGAATAKRLDRITVGEVLPELLDPAAWTAWPLVDPDWPAGAEGTLRQLAAAPPAPAPLPQAPAPTGGLGNTAPAAAAPRSPAARATPPTRAPARPPVRTAPAPVPAPAPPPVPAPAPPPQPNIDPPSWQEIHERNMARLRELAEAWAKAREEAGDRDRDDRDRGRGDR